MFDLSTRPLIFIIFSDSPQSTMHQLYGHLPPIMKTIQVRRTRHAGYCWRRRDELISDVLLWTPTYGRAKAGRPVRTYIQQLCEDTGCTPEDPPEAMNDREKWRERVRDIRAGGTTWWWWWYILAASNHLYNFFLTFLLVSLYLGPVVERSCLRFWSQVFFFIISMDRPHEDYLLMVLLIFVLFGT